MECTQRLAHNRAEEFVPQQLMQEVLAAIRETTGNSLKEVHKPLQAALEARGWETDVAVADNLKFTFDALKGGVAVEIEFGLQDTAFKEWAKFQKARKVGKATAGVHIVPRNPTDEANCSAEWVHATLTSFSDVFCVPVLILEVEP